jgi:hypothetical protein
MDVAGLESSAGGGTGSHSYSGPDKEKQWGKMKENFVKEWDEEQGAFMLKPVNGRRD